MAWTLPALLPTWVARNGGNHGHLGLLAIDLGKCSFHIHGIDSDGVIVPLRHLHATCALDVDVENPSPVKPVEQMISQHYGIALQRAAADTFLRDDVVRFAWRTKLSPHLTLDLLNDLRERAEAEAIHDGVDGLSSTAS